MLAVSQRLFDARQSRLLIPQPYFRLKSKWPGKTRQPASWGTRWHPLIRNNAKLQGTAILRTRAAQHPSSERLCLTAEKPRYLGRNLVCWMRRPPKHGKMAATCCLACIYRYP